MLCKECNQKRFRAQIMMFIPLKAGETSMYIFYSIFYSLFSTKYIALLYYWSTWFEASIEDIKSNSNYHIYSIKRPGHLFNFWTFRVGAYSKLGAY